MSEEIKETIKALQSNPLIKSGAYEFIGDSNVTYAEIYILLEHIRNREQENQQLKEQLRTLGERNYNIFTSLDKATVENTNLEYVIDKYKSVLDEIREWLKYKAEQLDEFDIPKRKETGAFWFATRGEIDSLLDKVKD